MGLITVYLKQGTVAERSLVILLWSLANTQTFYLLLMTSLASLASRPSQIATARLALLRNDPFWKMDSVR